MAQLVVITQSIRSAGKHTSHSVGGERNMALIKHTLFVRSTRPVPQKELMQPAHEHTHFMSITYFVFDNFNGIFGELNFTDS